MDLWARVLALTAFGLVVYAVRLPLWGMILHAPQYPNGLQMQVGPGFITGDLGIINVLNHYVGMKEIHLEDFREIAALPYVLWGWAAVILVAALSARPRWLWAAFILALVIGGVGLADLQYWLWDYGNNLDPRAPLDLDPFTPPMSGEYSVWNFRIQSRFMTGSFLLGLAGLLLALATGRCLGWRFGFKPRSHDDKTHSPEDRSHARRSDRLQVDTGMDAGVSPFTPRGSWPPPGY